MCQPKRVTENVSSLLDLIITDSPTLISDTTLLPQIGTSDHSVVCCRLDITIENISSQKLTIWDFKNVTFSALNQALRNAPFDLGYNIFDEVDDVVHYWFHLYNLSQLWQSSYLIGQSL